MNESEVRLIKLIASMFPEEMEREIKLKNLYNDHPFGCCSKCGKSDGYLNIGKSQLFYCDKHKKYWVYGINMFSSWRDESEKTWKKNSKKLFKYEKITGGEWIDKKISDENLDISKDLELEELPF